MLRILVCIKQVPDTTEIKIDPVTNTLIRAGVPSIVNPFDANALEMAVQLKEKYGGIITVISMGPAQAEVALKECLSVGADEAYLVTDRMFAGSDTLATSYILSTVVRSLGAFDLILCGKQAIDGDTGQVGPELAEHLDMARVTYAAEVALDDRTLTVKRETDDGFELVEAHLPVIITAIKTVANEPRLPSVKSAIAAEYASVGRITAEQLDIDPSRTGLKGSPTKVKKTFTPQMKKEGVLISGLSSKEACVQLADLLCEANLI